MKNIAIIRRSADDHQLLVNASLALPIQCVDVFSPQMIRVRQLGETATLELAGQHAVDFYDRIIFLNHPHRFPANRSLNHDEIYQFEERRTALIGALKVLGERVIYRSPQTLQNGLFEENSSQLKFLGKLGWRVPIIERAYKFETQEESILRRPDSSQGRRFLITLTAKRAFPINTGDGVPQFAHQSTELEQTSLALLRLEIPWLTIALTAFEDGLVAYGCRQELAANTPAEIAQQILIDILA